MERLSKLSIGDFGNEKYITKGTYGAVYRVQLKKDGGHRKLSFAKKKIPLVGNQEFVKEVDKNRRVNGHPNVASTLCFGTILDSSEAPSPEEAEGAQAGAAPMSASPATNLGGAGVTPFSNVYGIIIFEWCGDGNLGEYVLNNVDSLDEPEMMEMCRQMALGLQHLHSHGIVHGDLHRGNIMVKRGVCKIGDLGCATWNSLCSIEERAQHVGAAEISDILSFVSPQVFERISAHKRGDPALAEKWPKTPEDDIYSLGVIFLYLFKHGHIPEIDKKFLAESSEENVAKLIEEYKLPPALKRCVLKMLKVARSDRYSIDDVVLSLNEWYGKVVDALPTE